MSDSGASTSLKTVPDGCLVTGNLKMGEQTLMSCLYFHFSLNCVILYKQKWAVESLCFKERIPSGY